MIKRLNYLIILGIVMSTMAGCAFGRKVPYSTAHIDLRYKGTQNLALAVHDQREMVVDGSQRDAFVGYTRSGVGIAYPMTTSTKEPFSKVISDVMARAFRDQNLEVVIILTNPSDNKDDIIVKLKDTGQQRLILLTMNQMHTDSYGVTLGYMDLDMLIMDNAGNVLLEEKRERSREIGGNIWWGPGDYKTYSVKFFEEEFEAWMNEDQVRQALE